MHACMQGVKESLLMLILYDMYARFGRFGFDAYGSDRIGFSMMQTWLVEGVRIGASRAVDELFV